MINESELLRSVGATIFARGKDYLSEGLIEDTTRKGQTLIAHVQGSRHKPYRVTINLDDKNDVEEADCTCPYGEEWDGWCKHIVAVLLYEIQEATAPEPAAAPKTKVKKVSGISHDAIQKEVRKQFKQLERNSRYGYRNDYDEENSGVSEILDDYGERAFSYLDQNLPDSALALLTAFMEVFLEQWADYDEEENVEFESFGLALAKKLLRTSLTPTQRKAWLAALASWQTELSDYGDGEFDTAQEIVKNPESTPSESRDATTLRLALFGEQGRWEDALTLANQADWPGRSALYLTYLNRLDEMERVATKRATELSNDECVTLVETLQHQAPALALRLGKLFLPQLLVPRESGYYRYNGVEKLAQKVLELGQKQGDNEASRAAREALLLVSPTLDLWKSHFALLQPAEHESARTRLLKQLLEWHGVQPEQLAILLEEKEWESAWNIASLYSGQYALPVALRVVEHLPQPVRDYGLKIATPIMGNNQSAQYELAASWLAVVRTAEIVLGKGREWNQRYETLLLENKRKYKLMPLLQELEHAPEEEAPPPVPTPPAERKRLIFKLD